MIFPSSNTVDLIVLLTFEDLNVKLSISLILSKSIHSLICASFTDGKTSPLLRRKIRLGELTNGLPLKTILLTIKSLTSCPLGGIPSKIAHFTSSG